MQEKNVEVIENILAGTLRPITPRSEFVHGLGTSIHSFNQSLARVSSDSWRFVLLMLAGLLSLGVLLALAGRGLHDLLGLRKKP